MTEQFRTRNLEALRAEIERGASSGPGISSKDVFASIRTHILSLIDSGPDELRGS